MTAGDLELSAHLDILSDLEPKVQTALEQYGRPALKYRPPDVATLVRALVGQQLSTKAAATIYGRLVSHMRGQIDPGRLSRVRVSTLRRIGLSERKAESLKLLGKAVERGELNIEMMASLEDEIVVEQISALKGFGEWSAQMFLIFSLRRSDVWPCADVGVQNGLQRIFELDERPSPKLMLSMGEIYRPYRTTLSLVCWHVLDAQP